MRRIGLLAAVVSAAVGLAQLPLVDPVGVRVNAGGAANQPLPNYPASVSFEWAGGGQLGANFPNGTCVDGVWGWSSPNGFIQVVKSVTPGKYNVRAFVTDGVRGFATDGWREWVPGNSQYAAVLFGDPLAGLTCYIAIGPVPSLTPPAFPGN